MLKGIVMVAPMIDNEELIKELKKRLEDEDCYILITGRRRAGMSYIAQRLMEDLS